MFVRNSMNSFTSTHARLSGQVNRCCLFRHIVVMCLSTFAFVATASAVGPEVRVSITNNSPQGGAYITPVWIGFHNGSFDSYNSGLSSQAGLERIAEDGNMDQISDDFGMGMTYIDNSGGSPVSATVASSQAGDERQQGALGAGPLGPGASASAEFSLTASLNRFLSYASMVLPTSDYLVANGDPIGLDLQPLYGASPGTSVSFTIGGSVNDAGTEVNDFATSAGNPLYAGLPAGQSGQNEGADENGVVAAVFDPFADFLNRPANFDTDFSAVDFSDRALYPDGIATITVTVIPEPSSMALVAMGTVCGLIHIRRRCRGVDGTGRTRTGQPHGSVLGGGGGHVRGR